MIVIMKCRTCGYDCSLSTGVTEVKVTTVHPSYRPPCPVCGGHHEEIIIRLEEDDPRGTLEVTSRGGSGKVNLT